MKLDRIPHLNPKSLATAALLAFSPGLATAQETSAAVTENITSAIPSNSRLFDITQGKPADIAQQIESVAAQFLNAEKSDQTPPRSMSTFNSQLGQSGATIREPLYRNIVDYFPEAHASLLGRLQEKQYGLFVDGENNLLYVVQRQGESLVAIREMDVSTAKKGFDNSIGSNGSPYGEMWISTVETARLHEVIINNPTKHYQDGDIVTNLNGAPTISSVRLSISGYSDNNILAQRGAALHGSIQPGNASAGCFRLEDIDAAVLAKFFVIQNQHINEDLHTGTPMHVSLAGERENTPIQAPPVNLAVAEPKTIVLAPTEEVTQPSNNTETTVIAEPEIFPQNLRYDQFGGLKITALRTPITSEVRIPRIVETDGQTPLTVAPEIPQAGPITTLEAQGVSSNQLIVDDFGGVSIRQ